MLLVQTAATAHLHWALTVHDTHIYREAQMAILFAISLKFVFLFFFT
jgi:hypothetical protein